MSFEWEQIGGPAMTLITGENSLFATNPDSGDIYKYNNSPHNWTRIGGPGSMFVAGLGDRLCGLSPNKDAIYKYNNSPHNWTRIGGPAEYIAIKAAGAELFALSPNEKNVWRLRF